MRRSTLALLAMLAMGTAAAPAFAQDTSADAPPKQPDLDTGRDRITVGAGIASVPSYEGSDRSSIIGIAQAQGTIKGYAFSTEGTELSIDLVRNDPGPVWDFQLGPVVSLNFNRVRGIRDDQVEALGKKKVALELGGYIGIGKTGVITSPYDKLSANVTYTHDVTGIYKSYIVNPQVNYGTPLSTKLYVALSGGASYAGQGYASSYYSVDLPGSLRSGLPVYNAHKGWKNYSLSALANYSITGNLLHGLSVVGGVSYSHLMNDFAESPIVSLVGSRNQWFYAGGLAYTF